MKQIINLFTIFILALTTAEAQDLVFHPLNVKNGLSDNQVRYIIQLPDGRMVFKTSGNINIYDGANFKYIHQESHHIYPLKGYDGFYRIYQSSDSTLWIKDYHKLMLVDLPTEKYISNLADYFKKIGFKAHIDDIFIDNQQRLWLRSGNKLSLKNHNIVLNLSDNEGILQDVDSDKDCLYLFYNTGAIVCYELKSKIKKYTAYAYPDLQQAIFKNTSLIVKGKNGFYQLRNGSKGGFFFFDLKKRNWEKLLQTPYTLNTLVVDTNGIASISCANGIWIINSISRKKSYLPTILKKDGSKLNTEISTLLYDRQGGLWLGTANQGLLYCHPDQYMFNQIGRSYFPNNDGKDIIVQFFAEDKTGNIYVKCQSEIYRYRSNSPSSNSLELIDIAHLSADLIKKLHIEHSTQTFSTNNTAQLTDKHGFKWTGTADGLKVFDPLTRKQRTLYTKDGLSNNFIQAIIQDRSQNIWITTSYGINKLRTTPKSGKIHITSFGANSGTLEGEYVQGAAFESSDGRLFFGGINGFSILEPSLPSIDKLPFRPVFTNLFLRGQKVELGTSYDGRVILSKSAPYIKHIDLAYNQNFLTLEFSALNYQNLSQTYYRYQLEGIDKQWREIFSSRAEDHLNTSGILRLAYTNLHPGKYRLKVMASNNNLEWKGHVALLNFTIHPPWWKTTLAYVIFVAVAVLLTVVIIYSYLHNVRKRLEQTHREEILLIRIRNLINQQYLLHSEDKPWLKITDQELKNIEPNNTSADIHNQAEAAFITKAMSLVEKNLDVADYSVEQLSRDLNMDRTGLYRKLITLLDKSPSLFIRNIRVEKAAEMILEGKLSIAEIADRVGFSSSSYLSKCFQQRYGCKPSEYANLYKNQHS